MPVFRFFCVKSIVFSTTVLSVCTRVVWAQLCTAKRPLPTTIEPAMCAKWRTRLAFRCMLNQSLFRPQPPLVYTQVVWAQPCTARRPLPATTEPTMCANWRTRLIFQCMLNQSLFWPQPTLVCTQVVWAQLCTARKALACHDRTTMCENTYYRLAGDNHLTAFAPQNQTIGEWFTSHQQRRQQQQQ